MHSVSDLTTFSRKTSGEVPPKLVGASTTVVGDKVYLYGGRLVTERRMVTDMYVFDLKTLIWEKIVAPTDDSTPAQRYFHSADSWNQYLIIFGGMGLKPEADEGTEDLCVLNDVCFYDIPARRWMPPSWSLKENPLIPLPKPRYAHLSSVSGDRLFIIGGQDLDSVWLDDVYIYDLPARTWVLRRDYPRHCGTYRSVAVSADLRVHLPQEMSRNHSPPGQPLFRTGQQILAPTSLTSRDTLIHLPYSAQSTDDFPNEIYLYSNYNFTDVKRELEVLTPLPNGEFSVRDASSNMNGPAFPPGLRFPAGAILGTHLIIAGTYLAHSFQSFSVWALNLIDMSWTRIDPGSTLTTGSWFRSGLWAKANKFIVFGNRQGNLVDDYNRRLLSWDHIAMIDLEAFGIYQPPSLELDIRMQEMGLAALEEGVLADFEIVCDDDRRVKCSRKLLEDRWPWFKEQRRLFLQAATKSLDTLPLSATHVALPDVPSTTQEPRSDPRLTPRQLSLSEPYPITLALVQYFYSLALVTPLQHAPAVLSALLVLATNYDLGHLQSLVKHAMHRALSNSTSVGVYEVATLCSCRSLQIRALKTVMLYNQKRPSARPRQDREGGPSRTPDMNGNSGNGGAGDQASTARPRGMSDALMRSSDPRQTGGGGVVRGNVTTATKDDADSFARGAASGSKPSRLFLGKQSSGQDRSSISHFGVMDEELAFVAESHAPIISTPITDVADNGEYDPHPIHHPSILKVPERSTLRMNKRNSHVLSLPPPPNVASSSRLSPTPTSESDGDGKQSGRVVRPVTSLPSFHHPQRTRASTYRDRGAETPPLTSPSHSSLNSNSAISQTSALYTPPHSPPAHSFVFTDSTTPSSHLSVISEVNTPEDQLHRLSLHSALAKSAQTLQPPPRLDRPRSSSSAPAENEGQVITITPRSAPRRLDLDAYVYPSETHSPTGTVTNVILNANTVSTTPDFLTPTTATMPVTPASPSQSSFTTSSSSGGGGIGWPFGNKSKTSLACPEEKKRKKEESRMRKEQLAVELRRRTEARRAKADNASLYTARSSERTRKYTWEEDTAMYGSLALM
ncbi:hypothetical protein BJY52DRAFT_1244565 [Lactarius psammicola]|nr:hypothetical protein BJY52DRAFT_1244565 [Lactarius psammicola]